jgi:hypothetical protein
VLELHFAALGEHESIAEEERMYVSDDLSWQEKLSLAVRAWRCRCDFQPTSFMRDARDLVSIAEDDGAVVVEPADFQDFPDASAVRPYRFEKAVCSHSVPPVVRL